jgi:pyruvate kinase
MSEIKNNINIIATVGPSSMEEKIIKKMDKSGISVFRINLSHTNISDLKEKIKKLQSWTNKNIAIDTEGAQLRTGNLMHGINKIKLEHSQEIQIVDTDNYNAKSQIPINQKSITNIFYENDLIKIDFDSIMIRITKIERNFIIARVIEGGIIYSNKGISVDRNIDLPSFTNKDLEAIKIANECNLKIIFLSFCSNGEDVISLREVVNQNVKIISKIESESGLRNLDSICMQSDSILIDRGDLSRDVALEKISFAQKFIIDKSRLLSTPVYVATNLMENMIEYNNPTRAEINDISQLVHSGVSGLVLAAETAIGKNPIKCVRVLKSIINECIINEKKQNINDKNKLLEYLFLSPNNGIVAPHGGELVQQYYDESLEAIPNDTPEIYVNQNCILDIKQISDGVYSPVTKFMNLNEVENVIYNNKLNDETPWTIPITFNVTKEQVKALPSEGDVLIRSSKTKEKIGLMQIHSIEKIINKDKLTKHLFGTNDLSHPGVSNFINDADYIISGSPFIFRNNLKLFDSNYIFTPKQTREIFYHKNWQNIIGFHTRNIPHRGHEFIQKKALESSNADAVFISPVIGRKKKGDFRSEIIFDSYEKLITTNFFEPFGVAMTAFTTYSRYAGPREAVFTAICRKNYGCNNFIIGRDHTGVGGYYKPEASANIFKEIDTGINILSFDTVYYSKKSSKVTDFQKSNDPETSRIEISGTIIREAVLNNSSLPDYIIRKDILNNIRNEYVKYPHKVFH